MSVAGINGTADYPVYTPGKATGNVPDNNFSQQINQAKAGNIHTLHWFDTPEGDKPLGALGDKENSSITVYKPKDFDPENPVYKVKMWDAEGNTRKHKVYSAAYRFLMNSRKICQALLRPGNLTGWNLQRVLCKCSMTQEI